MHSLAGWRGFALPRLQARFNPFVGTLILGVMWAVWHLPGQISAFVYSGWIPAIMGAILAILILIFTKGRLSYKQIQ